MDISGLNFICLKFVFAKLQGMPFEGRKLLGIRSVTADAKAAVLTDSPELFRETDGGFVKRETDATEDDGSRNVKNEIKTVNRHQTVKQRKPMRRPRGRKP